MTGTIVATGTNTFSYTGTIVTDVVATAGTYDITVFGAQGGAENGGGGYDGGDGAEIEGAVVLTQGETIEIVVGGAGSAGNVGGGGGGGAAAGTAGGAATRSFA